MAFCSHCGAQMAEGAGFCGNCGKAQAPAGPPPPPPQAQYQQPAYQQPYAAAPAQKKTNWLLWIGGGIAAILLLVIVAVVGTGFFIAKKAKDAGFDTALMQRNPVLGAARMALAMNPEVDVVSMDEVKGELTIREKKTGKTITIKADDVKEGRISFTDNASGEKVEFGANVSAELPDWVPQYPGSKPQGAFSASGGKGGGGLVHFKVSDSVTKVYEFYQNEFSSRGYKVTQMGSAADGGMITGEDEANNRSVTATVGNSEGQTQVSITYTSKN